MQKLLWSLLIVVTLPVGCRRAELPISDGMVIASGTVTRNGLPLPHGRVSFHPENRPQSQTSPEATESVPLASVNSGKFEVQIAPGEYRVEFRQFESPTNAELTGGPSVQVLPAQFNDKSTLRASISPNGSNHLTFLLDETARP